MQEEHGNKLRLLKLLELLRFETDELHAMTTREILLRLESVGISCDRRTIYRDILLLNEQGYEIMAYFVGHEKAFYIEDRSFSIPELKILMDAVQAEGFVTEKKTKEIIDKIACLGGSHRGTLLKNNLVKFNACKHTNEAIYYTIESLENALQRKLQVSFYYFDLDENLVKKYRHDKKLYTVEPIALVYQNDNYYLMTYAPDVETSIKNYRVDRMECVKLLDAPTSEETKTKARSVAHYTGQAFRMYGGETKTVVIQLDESLIGTIYDKFGEKTKLLRQEDGTLLASLKVQISPTFWGWLFQFAGRMKLLSPESVVQAYKEVLAMASKATDNT